MNVRVIIVDDVPEVRQELRTLLALSGGLEIVGEAADGLQAYRLCKTLRPDVVLMDLEMPLLDGFEATRLIKSGSPRCRVIALTIHSSDDERRQAFESGVDSFIVKGAALGELTAAIIGDSKSDA